MQVLEKEQEEEQLWLSTLEEAHHYAPAFVARYHLASKYADTKSVCDIACGSGYGSYYLSSKAKEVVGIDASPQAVDWATKHFQNQNLRYIHAKGDEPWPIDIRFDMVTSFETLEHTHSPEKFLQNISDHLVASGTLIMSIPNGPKDRSRNNPFHLHHFTHFQLADLLEPYFSSVQYFSQIYVKDFKHYLTKPWRKLRQWESHRMGNYVFSPDLQEDVKTWLVIAKKGS